jgi:hypothetical protein
MREKPVVTLSTADSAPAGSWQAAVLRAALPAVIARARRPDAAAD